MLTREGIVRLLKDSGIDVVAEAVDANSLLGHVQLTQPDAAIVDIRMPPTHTDEGLVAAQQIRAEHPEVGVLLLSQYVEPSDVVPCDWGCRRQREGSFLRAKSKCKGAVGHNESADIWERKSCIACG